MLEMVRAAILAGDAGRATALARLAEATSPVAMGALGETRAGLDLGERTFGLRLPATEQRALDADLASLRSSWMETLREPFCASL
jgi:hypothetical protein